MKSSPYGEKRSGEMDMKPRMSSNFDKSGIKNADGSDAKPGAPGIFGKILDPLGLFKKGKKLLGGGGGGQSKVDAMKQQQAMGAGAGAAAAGAAPAGAAVPVDEQAGPAAPPAGVVPPDPTLGAAPVQMRKSGAPKLEDKNKVYSKEGQNLLKAVPNKKAYNKLSDTDKKGFDKAAKRAGLPMQKK